MKRLQYQEFRRSRRHHLFLSMLPTIKRHAEYAFRHLLQDVEVSWEWAEDQLKILMPGQNKDHISRSGNAHPTA